MRRFCFCPERESTREERQSSGQWYLRSFPGRSRKRLPDAAKCQKISVGRKCWRRARIVRRAEPLDKEGHSAKPEPPSSVLGAGDLKPRRRCGYPLAFSVGRGSG